VVGEHGRVDAAGQLAQLLERLSELGGERVDEPDEVGLVLEPRLEHPQLEGERDELLLGAVVEVALDPAARVVARLHDAQPRHAQLLQAGAREIVTEAREDLGRALEELRELARGIHPAILTDRGLGPAVSSLVQRSTVPVELAELPEQRLPTPVEAAAYFVVAESLTNVAKHAPAASATVRISRVNGHAVVEVSDDGAGGVDPARFGAGSGLRGLADRLAAVDGRLEVDSPAGVGTTVRAEIPCASS
jgi:signal transduction histidine kinase